MRSLTAVMQAPRVSRCVHDNTLMHRVCRMRYMHRVHGMQALDLYNHWRSSSVCSTCVFWSQEQCVDLYAQSVAHLARSSWNMAYKDLRMACRNLRGAFYAAHALYKERAAKAP